MAKKLMRGWGFDVKDIDTGVRPQDDFYRYANGKWLARGKIPPEESRWGSFVTLRYNTEQQLKKLVEKSRNPLIAKVYASAMDMKHRNKLGMQPLVPLLYQVEAAKTLKELLAVVADLHVLGVSGFFGAFVDQDSKDSTKYRLHLWQGGLSMPDRDYYLLDAPEQRRVRDAYLQHVERLLRLAGKTKAEIVAHREAVMRVETALARASMRKEDTRDAEKTYHKLPVGTLQRIAPAINWRAYLAQTHAKDAKQLIVGQPDFFAAVSKLLAQTPFEDLKAYVAWHVIDSCASLLSEKFVREQFKWSRVLTGQKKMRPLWRRALGAVGGTVGFELGREYIKVHFPAAAKREMDALVSDLFVVYAERMQRLDWMSGATKKRAIKKLRAMARKIGYPTKWRSYKGLVLKKDDYFGNMLRSEVFDHKYNMGKLRRPIDRTEWHMTPQTVNAYANFGMNEIVFPAAILQWPFFDLGADPAVNYAAIGSVIGHEMTHHFDDQGSKFDARGNMRGWWSSTDRKKFDAKGKLLKKQYDTYEVAHGVKVNGQLTLGENIADLGGLVIAWDAYQKYLARHGRKTIAGLSPEERFFFGFAQQERELTRPEFQKMQALTDPHSPAPFRINGPLSNFEPFYKTFGVKKGDKLYRPTTKRSNIW